MKFKTVQEKITCIHSWIENNHEIVSKKIQPKNLEHKILLAGKKAAYEQVMNFIQNKYAKYLIEINPNCKTDPKNKTLTIPA